MRYAQILNGKAHWILDSKYTLEELYTGYYCKDDIELIDITTQPQIQEGWNYIDGQFSAPQATEIPMDELKMAKLKMAGQEFSRRRDAIRWIGGYGYDSSSEDITNFLASYILLDKQCSMWDGVGEKPTTQYKVWKNEADKEIVMLTLAQMTTVYEIVRQSQFEAYEWYETVKAQISTATTKDELIRIPIDS